MSKIQFKHLKLSSDFMEHFEGFMIGDGSLSNIRKSPHSTQFLLGNKHEDYVEYLHKLLEDEGIECKSYEGYKGSFEGSSRHFRVETKFYVTFHELEKRWYQYDDSGKRRKTVPEDFILTPNALLQWFIGDGYVVNLRGNPQRIMFCTDRYTQEEAMVLSNQLKLIGVYNELLVNDRNRIRVPKREMGNLYKILPPCPVGSFKYKWSAM